MNLRMGSHGFAMAKIVLLLIVTFVVYPSASKAQNGCIIYYGGGAYDNVVYTSPAGPAMVIRLTFTIAHHLLL